MERRLLLDVVVRQRPPVLQLLAREDQPLLVRRDALLVLDLLFHVVDRVRRLDVQRDGLARQRLDEDLRARGRCRALCVSGPLSPLVSSLASHSGRRGPRRRRKPLSLLLAALSRHSSAIAGSSYSARLPAAVRIAVRASHRSVRWEELELTCMLSCPVSLCDASRVRETRPEIFWHLRQKTGFRKSSRRAPGRARRASYKKRHCLYAICPRGAPVPRSAPAPRASLLPEKNKEPFTSAGCPTGAARAATTKKADAVNHPPLFWETPARDFDCPRTCPGPGPPNQIKPT